MLLSVNKSHLESELSRLNASAAVRFIIETTSPSVCLMLSRRFITPAFYLDCQYWSENDLVEKLRNWRAGETISDVDYLQFIKGSLALRQAKISSN